MSEHVELSVLKEILEQLKMLVIIGNESTDQEITTEDID